MSLSPKRMLVTTLRLTAGVAAIWVVARGVSIPDLAGVWSGSDKSFLFLSLAVFLVVPFLQAMRLRWLLRSQAIHMGRRDSVRLAFAGNFLNFAAPLGSTAGDVFKAWYAGRNTTRKTEAAATVFVDRAVGLATLLLSVGVIALVVGVESRLGAIRMQLVTMTSIMVLGGLFYLSPFFQRSVWIQSMLDRQPQLRRIDTTTRSLLSSWRDLTGAVLITLVLQVFAALTFICIAISLGMRLGEAGPLDLYAHFSAGELVKALPGPPQGLGTMELAYKYFFAGLGSAAQIVSAAVGVRLVNLMCALPGVLFAFGSAARPVADATTSAAIPSGASISAPGFAPVGA